MRGNWRAFAISASMLVVLGGATTGLPAGAAPEELELPAISVDQLLEIANVPPPPLGVGLRIHADFAPESPYVLHGRRISALTAEITPQGAARTRNVVESPARRGTRSRDRGPVHECSDPTFKPMGATWRAEDIPIPWHFRRSSVPMAIGRFRTQKALRKAHEVWQESFSNCADEDDITVRFRFAGNTNRRIGFDGFNVVEFGTLWRDALAVNYAYTMGDRIIESDLRFNKRNFRWTNQAHKRKRFHVINVAVHELGHQVGLDDLGDPHGTLTMFGFVSRGERHKVTLGRGDLEGGKVVSP